MRTAIWMLGSLLSLLIVGAGRVPAGDWNQFRGPASTGVADPATIPLSWSSDENLAWKTPLPGSGWSQPIVIGQQVLVTAAVSDPPLRPKDMKAGVSDPRSMPGSKAAPPEVELAWQVLSLDLATGQVQWATTVSAGRPQYAVHPSNTYATETPAGDAQGVYVFFGATGTVAAVDLAGGLRWKQELGAHPTTENFGTGSSPVLFDGKLYVQSFNEDEALLVCYDARSGEERWRVSREKPGTSWSTPLVWTHAKGTEIIVSGSKLMTSHDPQTGAELWRVAGIDVPTTSSIAADRERIYFGYRSPFASGPLYALPAGARGDLSPEGSGLKLRDEAWSRPSAAPGMSSPLSVGGCLYVINGNVLTCHDAATGQPHYKERLAKLGTIAASPVAIDDKVVLLGETGHAVVIKVGPTFEALGTPEIPDVFWSSPAVADGRLLLRGVDGLYCVGL